MKTYRVVITDYAQEQLDTYINYIVKKLRNRAAARAVLNDFRKTVKELETAAAAPADLERFPGYKKITLKHHRYVMIYRITDEVVSVEYVFHELQDYENRIS
ncbi:MAG: type II toxin-antitoxin system RelE/ParE family toxin [Oscillospiraceae bacterium]|nr:type II toxin-antitoxin system RelE/ParE family toxin [Oscillospiraceae bacterium]